MGASENPGNFEKSKQKKKGEVIVAVVLFLKTKQTGTIWLGCMHKS